MIAGAGIVVILALVAVLFRIGLRSGLAVVPYEASPPEPVQLERIAWSDASFLSRWTERLEAAGFTHLMDFELPHVNTSRVRSCMRALRSADLATVATLSQRLEGGAVTEKVTLATWFEQGGAVLTSNHPHGEPSIDSRVIHMALPRMQDLAPLLASHQRTCAQLAASGRTPRRIGDPSALGATLIRHWKDTADAALGSGIAVREGDTMHMAAGFLARWTAWAFFGPVRLGRSLPFHALVGATAVAVGALAPTSGELLGGTSGAVLAWVLQLGTGMGLGRAMGANGFLWSFAAANLGPVYLGGGPTTGATFAVLLGWVLAVIVVEGADARMVPASRLTPAG